MTESELLDKIDAWAFAEGENEWTDAASFDYREGFKDACDAVRGLIQTNRESNDSEPACGVLFDRDGRTLNCRMDRDHGGGHEGIESNDSGGAS